MGLYIPTILGGNSYLSWFYDRGAKKDPAHTGTSKGLSQAINRGPIRKFVPNYANVYVTIQSHALSADVRPHYVTANGVRDGLLQPLPELSPIDTNKGEALQAGNPSTVSFSECRFPVRRPGGAVDVRGLNIVTGGGPRTPNKGLCVLF